MTTLAIGLVLLVVMVLMSLSFLLGRAVRGDQSRTVVFILLGFQTLSKLDVLLPLAFYLGILLTLSRWYRDSEMTVLAACGVGLMHFMRPVMVLGLVFGALALAGAFYFTPFATRQIEHSQARYLPALRTGGDFSRRVYRSAGDGADRLRRKD